MMKLVLRRGFDAVGRIDGGRVGNCKVDRGRGEGGGEGREGGGERGEFSLGQGRQGASRGGKDGRRGGGG